MNTRRNEYLTKCESLAGADPERGGGQGHGPLLNRWIIILHYVI